MKSIFSLTLLIIIFFLVACQDTPPAPAPAPPPPLPPAAASTPVPAPTVSGAMNATPSGLKYQDLLIGEGKRPLWEQTVKVDFVGKLESGKEFDKGKFQFKLGDPGTLKGFNIGVGGGESIDAMKIGGKRVIILPPDLAYGKEGNGNKIPPNATLRFEIELLDVKSDKAF